MKFTEGNKVGIQFGNGQDPTKGGRPKKIYTILKEQGYSKQDIATAFNELAWYKEESLRELISNTQNPVILKIVARCFLEALNDGSFTRIKEIIEHTIGKPNQSIQQDFTVDELPNIDLSSWK